MKTKFSILLTALAITFFAIGRVTANEQARLHAKTLANLSSSMHGEAFAHAKYLLFAEHARKNGNAELADLFEKTAAVEQLEHLREQADLAGIIHSDEENLKEAIKGENTETTTMYPGFAREARAVGDFAAARLFEEISKDEANHRDAFRTALTKIEAKTKMVAGH